MLVLFSNIVFEVVVGLVFVFMEFVVLELNSGDEEFGECFVWFIGKE